MIIQLEKFYNFLIPYSGPMMRIGNIGDGGYVISPESCKAQNLLSFGLGLNWTFELDWLKQNPDIDMTVYDGTVDTLTIREAHGNHEWVTDLISSYCDLFKDNRRHIKENVTVDNIEQILQNVTGDTFIKMDIEGGEFDLIPHIVNKNNIIGIVIEFHLWDSRYSREVFKEFIESFTNYKILHVHANNFEDLRDTDSFPKILEITFLRKDRCDQYISQRKECYLQNLDSPNNLDSRDYFISFDHETSSVRTE